MVTGAGVDHEQSCDAEMLQQQEAKTLTLRRKHLTRLTKVSI